ncbi:hypothetical protein [Bizionia sp.]|uniref:hypothetical protein n=1 Tax=Bizionia sp. TaxID=1954480 RepID=UPI003A8EE2D8
MNKKFRNIIGLVFTALIISSCSIYGTYRNRFNNGHGSDWIKINSDKTFEYINWGHMTGYAYVKGSWKEKNDSIFLTKFDPKPPTSNKLIEIKDEKRNIKLLGKNEKPLMPVYIKINGVLDSIKSDWDGNYSYSNFKSVNRIEVYDLGSTQGEIGQIIADFKTDCNNCSYKLIIDWDKISLKKIDILDSIWTFRRNRLYPIDSKIQNSINDKIRYFKKTDTIIPLKPWINSWNNMSNGFD